jgi:hypothetical protein
MAVLTPQQRTTLETAVKLARKVSELGAFNALHGMAVDHPEPFAHMDIEQRRLRNSLRSKARLLGDALPANGAQQIDHLGYELAYETWHKMLFAKFLEANQLLMHTDGVAVTMQDCEELAPEEGFTDKWDAAANYAGKMLPAIFRIDDPLMQVAFASNDRIKLEEIIDGLEDEIFSASDALGWVYQFWQSQAKADINARGDKIDGEKLPAVTQLFTEPYMVDFLIDNTLGAWWVSRNPGVTPPVKFEYLRFSPPPPGVAGRGLPAAGKFEGWPDKTAEVTSLDPCMGSGHFVASLFPVFAALRMNEEGLTKEEATDKVITENLHGLELDARCTQIAAFNLALTAWKFCGHYKELPEMNLACSGIAPKGKVEDWVGLVGKVERADDKARLENGMKMLYQHFQLAPELGSLLDPTTIKADAFTASFEELQPVLKIALENEADTEQLERGVMAAGIAKAGALLNQKYTCVLTNVPFKETKQLCEKMQRHIHSYYIKSKTNLATVFIDRIIGLLAKGGTLSIVSPHEWLFLISYNKFRYELLTKTRWNYLVDLGEGAFSSSAAAGAFTALVSLSKDIHTNIEFQFAGLELEPAITGKHQKESIISDEIILFKQSNQLLNPDYRIGLFTQSKLPLLSKYASSFVGLQNGDSDKFLFCFWEIDEFIKWAFLQMPCASSMLYTGRSGAIKWENGKGELVQSPQAYIKGKEAWGKKGVAIRQTRSLPATIYNGELYDQSSAAIIPLDEGLLIPIWCYCSSTSFHDEVRKIDKKKNVTNATLVKIPFDKEYWQKVAADKYPNGLPNPYSDDSTQWLFHGHPIKTENPLQVALARVLGYRWPAESDTKMELADEAIVLIEAVKAFDYLSDDDGIFCIPSVNAEQAGSERLREYLQQVFAGEWNNQTITQLLQKEGAKSSNLEAWLRDEFFAQHCKLFKNRPFIWHIWDGRKDGFSALVNYHMLTKENFSKLIYTYLNDWIRVCVAKKNAGESGAEGLLSAAEKLKEKLETILQGEAPYDIFVRWKPLAQQPMGWEPDLNDGVRLNIRPFVEAGVLRSKFNVKWGVDRGKNPPNSFWGDIRDNDAHLTLDEKKEARENLKK